MVAAAERIKATAVTRVLDRWRVVPCNWCEDPKVFHAKQKARFGTKNKNSNKDRVEGKGSAQSGVREIKRGFPLMPLSTS